MSFDTMLRAGLLARDRYQQYEEALTYCREHAARLELLKVPLLPKEAGILEVERQKSRKRVAHRNDNPHGSFRINDKLNVNLRNKG